MLHQDSDIHYFLLLMLQSASNGRLVAAAKAGNTDEVRKLLSVATVNVNFAEWVSTSPMFNASNFALNTCCTLSFT